MGVNVGDKVVFVSTTNGFLIRKKQDSDVKKVLNEVAGIWKDHPLFKDKTTKEIIEMVRGPDDETR